MRISSRMSPLIFVCIPSINEEFLFVNVFEQECRVENICLDNEDGQFFTYALFTRV